MCGIAGVFHFNDKIFTAPDAHQVLEALKHRGPDRQQHYCDQRAALYHCRLSIIDTSEASDQPFGDKNILVYNGEIFNYRELREGLDVKTDGDVEVLYKMLSIHGVQALEKLNGFFAFAYYDRSRGALLLARDRYGVKPLYYYHDGEKFAFASELKPLLKLIGPQELNNDALYAYLRLNYPAGKETIFRNVRRLRPSECIAVTREGEVKISNWYHPVAKEPEGSLFEKLDDAVRLRLRADVPVGCFLSGGLDSSIIAALAVRHKPSIQTFSIGFPDQPHFDESTQAAATAQFLGTKHETFQVRENELLLNIQPFLESIDEPFADSSAFNVYVLSKLTSGRARVALSGDGADELFRGYRKHRALYTLQSPVVSAMLKAAAPLLPGLKGGRAGKMQNLIRQMQKLGSAAATKEQTRQQFMATISGHAYVAATLKKPFDSAVFEEIFRVPAHLQQFDKGEALDLNVVLADDMLVKTDRFSMRHGLELRNPFLDYRVVEHALNLPANEKISSGAQKIILRKTFGHLLPDQVLKRRKKGFELPLHAWLTGPLRERITNEWLNEDRVRSEGILNYTAVSSLLRELQSKSPGDSAARVWALIIFQSWLSNFNGHIR